MERFLVDITPEIKTEAIFETVYNEEIDDYEEVYLHTVAHLPNGEFLGFVNRNDKVVVFNKFGQAEEAMKIVRSLNIPFTSIY